MLNLCVSHIPGTVDACPINGQMHLRFRVQKGMIVSSKLIYNCDKNMWHKFRDEAEMKITFTDGENEDERVQTFVVNTFNVDRAMMLITHYLKNKEEECEKQAKEKGHEFRKREIHTAIESAKPIPVGRFIPKEFSMAYME